MLRKDKPIIDAGRAGHPQLAKLPEWPATTIAVEFTLPVVQAEIHGIGPPSQLKRTRTQGFD